MKNSSVVIENKKQQPNFFKRSYFILFVFALFQINLIQAFSFKHVALENVPSDPIVKVNPYFANVINKIKTGHFFNATVSTLNEKTKGKEVDLFSSYGFTQDVNKLNDQTLELKNLSTAFSDRAFFSGSKTVESIILTENGNKVNVEVTFITWSNTKAVLSNVVLKKINKVTFITGYTINGSNATYYTIALQDMGTIN
tara:strand:- start:10400 stop:10993 length:594 start_codon:yes stop_codon:yes gene_type:complete